MIVSTSAAGLRCVLDAKASLGECPTWSVAEQVLYWVDINAPSLNRFDPATGENIVMPMPESIGCCALRRSGGFTAHAYDPATGTPLNARIFARFTDPGDRPDGAAVDSEGCYWTAQYRGGKLKRMAADGRLLSEFPLPAMCPTMCAFGGPDLRTLYVTSARQQRDAEELARLPLSGGIFSMRVRVPGLPEPSFAG